MMRGYIFKAKMLDERKGPTYALTIFVVGTDVTDALRALTATYPPPLYRVLSLKAVDSDVVLSKTLVSDGDYK